MSACARVLLTMDVQFQQKLSAAEVETAVDRLEKAIRQRDPRIKHIYIEAGAISSSGRDSAAPG